MKRLLCGERDLFILHVHQSRPSVVVHQQKLKPASCQLEIGHFLRERNYTNLLECLLLLSNLKESDLFFTQSAHHLTKASYQLNFWHSLYILVGVCGRRESESLVELAHKYHICLRIVHNGSRQLSIGIWPERCPSELLELAARHHTQVQLSRAAYLKNVWHLEGCVNCVIRFIQSFYYHWSGTIDNNSKVLLQLTLHYLTTI